MVIPWTYEAKSFVPAFLLVGLLALWGSRNLELAKRVLAEPRNRLLLIWFLTAFAMANHEFAMRPVQALHFDRGYVWTPLFLLGVGPLQALLGRLLSLRWRPLGALAAVALLLFFCLDNIAWLGQFPRGLRDPAHSRVSGVLLTPDQKEALDWLSANGDSGTLLLSRSHHLGYLATVYTPLRSWASHYYTTPGYEERRAELKELFERGVFRAHWRTVPLLIVLPASGTPQPWTAQAREVFRNTSFRILRLPATR